VSVISAIVAGCRRLNFTMSRSADAGGLGKNDHAAIGVYEELDSVPWLQSQVLANSFRNRKLPFDSDCGFPCAAGALK
jgi:hypothetical protein